MKMETRFLAAGLALASMSALASADSLGLGDKAPALEVAKWFKGEPTKLGDGKMINVIEFWATW